MADLSKITTPDGTDYNLKDLYRGCEFVYGTQTATTGTWTGVTADSELVDGKQILYFLPFAGSGNATLNLTLANGTTTGAKNVYFQSTTRMTTHYGQYSQFRLIYHKSHKIGNTNYEGWWSEPGRDTTTTNATQIQMNSNAVKAGSAAIVKVNIIVAGSDGLYKHLKTATAFDITWPILYAAANIAAGATSNDVYREINFVVATTQSITLTAQKPVYIKGTLSGTTFTPVSTAPLTQTIPSTADGYQYIYLGYGYASTAIRLTVDHPIFEYKDGAFRLYGSTDHTYTGTGLISVNASTGVISTTATANTGTITSVKTTAGAHTAINVTSGAAEFNVPTKTSHLTNDSGFVTTDTNNRRAFYGTCSTAAATAAKVVTLANTDGWELKAGTVVGVKFTNSNSASNVTLNVNGSGPKSIYYGNAAYTGKDVAIAGSSAATVYYMYDGTYWVWLNYGKWQDTDTKVRQTLQTGNADRPLLMAYSDNTVTTSNVDNVSYRNNSIYANPSTGTVTATNFSGKINNHTVNADVPSDAVFTDHTYSGTGLISVSDAGVISTTATSNTGTITQVKTTAGAHTAINKTSGAANFNVPTKTSHLTNDSNFVTGSSTSAGYLALLTAANTIGNGPKIIPFRKVTNISGKTTFSYTGVSFTVPSGYLAILSVRARFVSTQPDQVAVNTSSTTLGDYQIISISESGNTSLCYYNAESTTATFYVWAKYYSAGNNRVDIEGIYLTNLGTFVDTI